MASLRTNVIEHASASLTLPGQAESGDRYVIVPLPEGTLVAVVDGLGHGRGAANAAERAAEVIQSCRSGEPLGELVQRCHEQLFRTRGVVMSLALFDGERGFMTWIGVGNVEGRLLSRGRQYKTVPQNLILRAGVVGVQLPALAAAALPLKRGDVAILATDGISPDFAEDIDIDIDGALDTLAARILATHRKGTDDALVLVVRFSD